MLKRCKMTLFTMLLMTFFLTSGNADCAQKAANNWHPEFKSFAKVEIVPDRFLRRWDGLTLFFRNRTGIKGGGPEDHPEKYVTMMPEHPGAYAWIDEYTLMFHPSEPWKPLTSYRIKVGEKTFVLNTLMQAPVSTIPVNQAKDLDLIQSITLFFADKIDIDDLAQMITLELRPLPGIEDTRSRFLNQDQFEIKMLERPQKSGDVGYVVNLKEKIPQSTRVLLHLKLAADNDFNKAFYTLSFSTTQPFEITHAGSVDQAYPITPTGVLYTKEQAIECSFQNPAIDIRFSSPPDQINILKARNLVRFTPAVDNLAFSTTGKVLTVHGKFMADTLYQMEINPIDIKDDKGRPLHMEQISRIYFYFPPKQNYLQIKKGYGLVERYGPQMIALAGRGMEKVDVRVYPVDPMNRSFWPFPSQPVSIDEDDRPPAPGQEPSAFKNPGQYISTYQLSRHLKTLGAPPVSQIVSIPLKARGNAYDFGLDLKPLFEQIAGGPDKPGTYLVGIRNLDESRQRHFVRVQVTDLSLTTVEEDDQVHFFVTSIASAKPVKKATISLYGMHTLSGKKTWEKIVSGKTDSRGQFVFDAPGRNTWRDRYDIRRIVVQKDEDQLVLNPTRPPDRFYNNVWESSSDTWLQWAFDDIKYRKEQASTLCHIFTERPVYRPQEPVYIKGYIRHYEKGLFSLVRGKGFLIVNGPSNLQWRYPLEIDKYGGFFHKFDEDKLPTGMYNAYFEYAKQSWGQVSFRKEAYRLPKFEVNLNGPDKVSLDQDFTVTLTSRYYAGGTVNQQPVRLRVTQFPYTWTPKKREGFYYSTDARFSGQAEFKSSPVRYIEDHTDDQGSCLIHIDPTIEPTAQPRKYIVEATVTGTDDQTVSNTHQVLALPPFVLGMKTDRYIKNAQKLTPEIIVVGKDGNLIEGQKVSLRVFARQWHSHLQATDFSQGHAKYITDVVDTKIYETVLTSQKQPLSANIPIQRAGVYIIEIDAADKIGRSQALRIDLFAGGDQPVTWANPPSTVFKVTCEKKAYAPGDKAVLILESPFPQARVLSVLESPDGKNQYEWIDVKNGQGRFKFEVLKEYMPRIPVHFVLMRGRSETDRESQLTDFDLEKPKTMAATAWVEVLPDKHRVNLALDYPEKAQPGQEITVKLSLTDDRKKPIQGQVTLWLVDQAVLSLGTEQNLDPLPDFIVHRDSRIEIRDTRNRILGYFPLMELPGGEMAKKAAMEAQLLDKVTIRKNFTPVPYFNPSIVTDSRGKAQVKIKLPDNLTNFKIRAKAVSSPDRFGFAKGHLAVRLPVIVQPSLPRFARPFDRFTAVAVSRIVDGPAGQGESQIKVTGLTLTEPDRKEIVWQEGKALRLTYHIEVPPDAIDINQKDGPKPASIAMAVWRKKDNAKDAFKVDLPLVLDQNTIHDRQLLNLSSDTPMEVLPVKDSVRAGSLQRSLMFSRYPAIVKMAAGLDYLIHYPYSCTEQRISRARAQLATRQFKSLGQAQSADAQLEKGISQTLEWLESVETDKHLIAYWPGSKGSVALTAWTVQFLVEARQAGHKVKSKLFDDCIESLKQSLRSDYSEFITGQAYEERCWALTALCAADQIDKGYVQELFRKADYLNLESKAQVAYALTHMADADEQMKQTIFDKIWQGVIFKTYQGQRVYGGLKQSISQYNPLILPSETRVIAEVLRAAASDDDKYDSNKQVLVNTLITLGTEDGWGTTNANSSALLALYAYMQKPPSGANDVHISIKTRPQDQTQDILLAGQDAYKLVNIDTPSQMTLSATDLKSEDHLICRVDTQYLPQTDGSRTASAVHGFVVNRELLKVGDPDMAFEKNALDQPGKEISFEKSTIVEDHTELVNAQDRHYVAVVVPMAAGMEPLNPNLVISGPEAKPAGTLTLAPDYVNYLDDHVAFYYNTLPKGTYHFYFRTRATVPGRFIQPAAYAEMMYDQSVRGNSNGAAIVVLEKMGE